MTPGKGSSASRRLQIASLILGLFVLLDVSLFGWLIFRSLSKREIERVLGETRQEAEGLAERLAGRAREAGEDLYTVTAMEREIQTYIDSVLKQRKFVRTVEVVDSEGKLVFRGAGETTYDLDPAKTPLVETREVPSRVEIQSPEREATFPLEAPLDSLYELDVPIGDLGFLQVGISQGELQRSVEVLRSELVAKTATIGGLTLAALLVAYLIIWRLWQRSLRLEEQAREAERMAYIGTLASGLAHEIRNPLNSLNLNMQMLEEDLGDQREIHSGRRLLSLTREEIGRLERLVTDFLWYAKPRPLELEEIAAVELLERCRDLLGGELTSRQATLEVEDSSDGARVRVDPAQLGQLLMNLVQNALTASEEAAKDGAAPWVALRALRDEDMVVLEVEDRGEGIPSDEQKKIFDLFYSTRKGGTGLGLAIVERIARTHEGSVEVESVPGGGTKIRVRLPEARRGAENGGAQLSVSSSNSSGVRNSSRSSSPQTVQRASRISPSSHSKM